MARKASSNHELKRKRTAGKRAPRECVLIVCEGKETEPDYFKRLCDRLSLGNVNVEVEIRGDSGSAPVSVVDFAVGRMKEQKIEAKKSPVKVEFGSVWCVMDVEQPPHKTICAAVKRAKDTNLEVALSHPCFEYWYLLHFEETCRSFYKNKEVIKALREHLPNYDKAADVFDTLYPNTDTAIRNAKFVIEAKGWQDERDIRKRNPSTYVYTLVEKLKAMAEAWRLPDVE